MWFPFGLVHTQLPSLPLPIPPLRTQPQTLPGQVPGLPQPLPVISLPTQLLSKLLPEELWEAGLTPHCSLPAYCLWGRKFL